MDDTDIEYKPLEAVHVGEIIVGPTPGLKTVIEKIRFLWSAIPVGHDRDTFHKQIVVGRDNARGRLRTVMITSLGETDIGTSISDRYNDIPDQKKREITREEWMKNIRYFVPLEPTELETDPTHMYEQPQAKVQYQRGHNKLEFAHWAFIAKEFSVAPINSQGPSHEKHVEVYVFRLKARHATLTSHGNGHTAPSAERTEKAGCMGVYRAIELESIRSDFLLGSLSFRVVPHVLNPNPSHFPLIRLTIQKLAAHIDAETFKKSQSYGSDKGSFSGFDLAGRTISRFGYGPDYEIRSVPMPHYILLTSVWILQSNTFVLEEKHAFNKATPKLFVTDLVKGWLLMLAIGAPFLSVLIRILNGQEIDSYHGLWDSSFDSHPLPDRHTASLCQPIASQGRRLAHSDRSSGHVAQIPAKAPTRDRCSKRSSQSNPYFFGLSWVCSFPTFLGESLIYASHGANTSSSSTHSSQKAHPNKSKRSSHTNYVGHWLFAHPTKLLFISQFHIFSIPALFPAFLHAPPVLRAFDFPQTVAEIPPSIVAFFLFQMILTPAEAVIGAVMNALSRRFEWQADRFARELAQRLKEPSTEDMDTRLRRALTTLLVKNLSTIWVDWLYSAYRHSHPTLLERLRAINAFQATKLDAANTAVKKEL
ncbi:uncharacterized protein FOMMEDRAFT_158976 [Fomitiporia mediterranea MF3/22]|uniref:uncharacterized protein n=1 Tax=Fomitiporia mediterranea (strain MF3/22) TaxID=694068 RepID=UPI0004407CAA|nr:uncharacterized protein FOMMEDRAFT_158976 [Fomitiporia mediterranea MF3/22]EJD00305.1 hypothetical protein FOMMEDRAFT_158976 [Fomitiporia mediterranea MF3/22]